MRWIQKRNQTNTHICQSTASLHVYLSEFLYLLFTDAVPFYQICILLARLPSLAVSLPRRFRRTFAIFQENSAFVYFYNICRWLSKPLPLLLLQLYIIEWKEAALAARLNRASCRQQAGRGRAVYLFVTLPSYFTAYLWFTERVEPGSAASMQNPPYYIGISGKWV